MKILSLFLLVAASLPILAQEDGVIRSCRVIFLERPRDAPPEAYLFDGKKSHLVSLSSMNLSEPIQLSPGATTIGITSGAVNDPELFPAAAPSAKIPTNTKEFYVVLLSDPKNKHFPVRCLAMSADGEKVKLGETLWVNTSRNMISGKIGDTQLEIAPGKAMVGKSPLKKPGYYKVQFKYKQVGEKEFQPIMNKTWWFDPQSKYLGFITNKGDRLPKIFMFRDKPAEKPEEGENGE